MPSTAARAVARSNLFKCAVHGNDPNWGRVLSALGTTDVAFEPDRVDVASTGSRSRGAAPPATTVRLVDLSGREVVRDHRPGRRQLDGQRVDQRPDRRVRPRELGLLLMTLDPSTGRTRAHWPRRSS